MKGYSDQGGAVIVFLFSTGSVVASTIDENDGSQRKKPEDLSRSLIGYLL